MPAVLEGISLEADRANLHLLRGVVAATMQGTSLTPRERALVVLAVDEACSSLIADAERRGATGRCRVAVDVDDVRVRVTVEDGTGSTGLPLFALMPEQLLVRGWRGGSSELSVFLLRAVMDEVVLCARRSGPLRLELVKFIGLAGADIPAHTGAAA